MADPRPVEALAREIAGPCLFHEKPVEGCDRCELLTRIAAALRSERERGDARANEEAARHADCCVDREETDRLREALTNLMRRLDEHFGGEPAYDWREQAEARAALAPRPSEPA